MGSFSNSLTIGDDEVEVFITPVIRSGYYEGCNLDWHVRCYLNGFEEDEWETTPEVASVVNEYVEFIENIYSQYSEPLGVTAIFSNGETIYHKVA